MAALLFVESPGGVLRGGIGFWRYFGSPALFVKTGLDGLLEYNWESSVRGGFPPNGSIATRSNCTQVGVV